MPITPPPKGFDSYLDGILPPDQALLAGAFSYSMQQVRNIDKVPPQEFAKIVYSMENASTGLPDINGSTVTVGNDTFQVPTNQSLARNSATKEALGAGPQGTYTMSNFFGAMSGLPYPWARITQLIKNTETFKLRNIYQEMFLAVTWEEALVDISQPHYYKIAKPYVAPTVTPNNPNPDYQPDGEVKTAGSFTVGWEFTITTIGTTDYTLIGAASNTVGETFIATGAGAGDGTATPVVNLNQYINPVTGAETKSPSYYSDGGKREYYDWYYTVQCRQTEDGGGYGRGSAPPPKVQIAIRFPDGSYDTVRNLNYGTPSNPVWSSPTRASMTSIQGTNPQDCASIGRKTYGRVTTRIDNGGPYLWLPLDPQQKDIYGRPWEDKTGQDTVLYVDDKPVPNPPPTPIYPPRPDTEIRGTSLASPGLMPIETITIEYPPILPLPVQANGNKATDGKNTQGRVTCRFGLMPNPPATVFWTSPGNSVTQGYINQANLEIQTVIAPNSPNFSELNNLWEVTGINLKLEQRSRYIALAPVPVPWDTRYADIPVALNAFVDSIPEFAQQTEPNMTAQTLENISNVTTPGGQSVIGQMRQERNQTRLAEVGIELDNNITRKLPPQEQARWMVNGTLPTAVVGIPGATGANLEPVVYVVPSYPTVSNPITYWDCEENLLKIVTSVTPGTIRPILEGEGCPIVGPEVPEGPGPEFPPPGNPFEPGEGGGSGPGGGFPPYNTNRNTTGTTLRPNTYTVDEAIARVIACNCDCWIE